VGNETAFQKKKGYEGWLHRDGGRDVGVIVRLLATVVLLLLLLLTTLLLTAMLTVLSIALLLLRTSTRTGWSIHSPVLARTGGTALVSCSVGSLLLLGGVMLAAPARTLHTGQVRAILPKVALLAWTLLLRSRRLV
jgi:hypothetical protein